MGLIMTFTLELLTEQDLDNLGAAVTELSLDDTNGYLLKAPRGTYEVIHENELECRMHEQIDYYIDEFILADTPKDSLLALYFDRAAYASHMYADGEKEVLCLEELVRLSGNYVAIKYYD